MSGQLIKHAYYNRHIKTPNGIIELTILRVKCKCCNKTHAIFPTCIVPYSQVLLKDHLSILNLIIVNPPLNLLCHIMNLYIKPILFSNCILKDLKMLFNFDMNKRDCAIVLLLGLPQLNKL